MGTGGFPTIGHQQTCCLLSSIILDSSYTLKIAQDKSLRFHQFNLSVWAIGSCEIKDFYVAIVVFRPQKPFTSKSLFGLHTALRVRKSPRPISNAWLKMLPLLHLHPINVIIYNGTYWLMP